MPKHIMHSTKAGLAYRTAFTAVLAVLFASWLAGCGGGGSSSDGPPGQSGARQLMAISVTPSTSQIASRSVLQFVATGIYSDHATQDLTASVTWQSTNASIASISNTAPTQGVLSAVTSGAVTVSATYGAISGTASLTVTPATLLSLAITPVQPSIARGTRQQFTATGTYSDNSVQNLTTSVTWRSSSTSVASISDADGSKGLAVAGATGTSTISASSGTLSATTTLTVTPATLTALAITPVNPSIAVGLSRQFTAIGTYSDNSTQDLTATVNWTSSNPAVAKASDVPASKGAFSGLSVGTASITAVSGSLSSSTTLTVTAATLSSLAITPLNPSIARGTSRQFTATGTYSDNSTQNLTTAVAWYSSNTTVATISNAGASKGLATSLATGSTVISAATGSVSASTTLTVTAATLVSIAVTPTNQSIASGASTQFTATGTYTDGSSQNLTANATWNSSALSVAQVSNATGSKGLATGVGPGTVTISATSGTVSGSTSMTVTAATSGTIGLAWDAVTAYADGSPLTDLAGYKVYYGTAPGSYSSSIDVGKVTTYTISNLPSGVYYVVVTVRNLSGKESGFSNEVSKSIP